VDLETLLPEVAQLTAPRWRDATQAEGHPVELRVEVTGPAVVEGSSSTLREALTNLIFNAVDVLATGGSVTLRARHSGDEVVVEVADTGPGIPPEVRARIFEPFFTTKGERGTGLGLAQVMAAVEQHHGRVEVETAPGQGTTFRLVFPAATRRQRQTLAAGSAETSSSGRRSLRILAVDDEERLATLVARLLEPAGHRVSIAVSGEQAVEMLRGEAFDLVISDLGMGAGMNGWELADQVRAGYPACKVIVATGWGAAISDEEAGAHGVVAVVAKPYTAAELREIVAGLAARSA
jgi:CheY-like chemotaxis protein